MLYISENGFVCDKYQIHKKKNKKFQTVSAKERLSTKKFDYVLTYDCFVGVRTSRNVSFLAHKRRFRNGLDGGRQKQKADTTVRGGRDNERNIIVVVVVIVIVFFFF